MERVGSLSFQRKLASGMIKAQERIQISQLQLASGKKATTYRDMGTDVRPTLTARSLIEAEGAHSKVAERVGQVLAQYDDGLTGLHEQVTSLRESLGRAIATGEAHGLSSEMDAVFSSLSATLNLTQGGDFLMAGVTSDRQPFTPGSMADLVALPTTAAAFANDDVPLSARVSEGTDMPYGLRANDVGQPVAQVLRDLAALGPPVGKLTSADMDAIGQQFSALKGILDGLTDIQASNGQKQSQIEFYTDRSNNRTVQLEDFIEGVEDVDVAEVVTRLATQRTALEASYRAFSQMSEMSLVNFLR